MNLRVTCFVYDKNKNLVNRHTFFSNDEKTLYAEVNGFNFAMCRYAKDYKIISTPIEENAWELNEEEKDHE